MSKLVQQIQTVVKSSDVGLSHQSDKTELVSELKRLDNDLTTAANAHKHNVAGVDVDAPAKLHSIIPELPPDFRLSNDIKTLTKLILNKGLPGLKRKGCLWNGLNAPINQKPSSPKTPTACH